ncbi:hypothetical protein ACMFMF_005749 [Clarireedia jacksonii]
MLYQRFADARLSHERAAKELEKVRGSTHPATLTAGESLVMPELHIEGTGVSVLNKTMEEVYQTRKETRGKEHPHTLLSACNLARVKGALGSAEEAEKQGEKLAPITKEY